MTGTVEHADEHRIRVSACADTTRGDEIRRGGGVEGNVIAQGNQKVAAGVGVGVVSRREGNEFLCRGDDDVRRGVAGAFIGHFLHIVKLTGFQGDGSGFADGHQVSALVLDVDGDTAGISAGGNHQVVGNGFRSGSGILVGDLHLLVRIGRRSAGESGVLVVDGEATAHLLAGEAAEAGRHKVVFIGPFTHLAEDVHFENGAEVADGNVAAVGAVAGHREHTVGESAGRVSLGGGQRHVRGVGVNAGRINEFVRDSTRGRCKREGGRCSVVREARQGGGRHAVHGDCVAVAPIDLALVVFNRGGQMGFHLQRSRGFRGNAYREAEAVLSCGLFFHAGGRQQSHCRGEENDADLSHG